MMNSKHSPEQKYLCRSGRIMRLLFLPLWISCFYGCREAVLKEPGKVIALQPLNGYDAGRLAFARQELQQFYHNPVIVLPERELPAAFINTTKGKRYSAPLILEWLASTTPDTALCTIGLTSEDIYTVDKDAAGNIKKPESKYAIWGIFGLGYCPGKACVVSDRRLMTPNEKQFRHRLRTVLIHEAGHNLGLPHCPNAGCIMSDANEKIATIDHSNTDLCPQCRKQTGLQ